ncbi:MAG: imidazole glycerol phosphate synthase subunit HisH [Ruminococcaceae bacterium]|nr:imidazole glycerol phosphate synthase subunit HisH [Oscillospiraceae bacterium]
MKKIGIIDYGMGNLHSVKNALDFLGADSFITSDRKELEKADSLLLPGVGAFPDAWECLKKENLVDYLRTGIGDKPLLGICLGMQLLFADSYEFRHCEGLGLIEGSIIRLTAFETNDSFKIPHMGWNSLHIHRESPLLKGIREEDYVYFVHSFRAQTEEKNILASTEYGELIPALVSNGKNVYGAQFHPEKSEKVGLTILKNFVEL